MDKKVKISALYITKEKGKAGNKAEYVQVKAGGGIVGDRHCEEALNPISICVEGIGEWMEAEATKGLCFQRFKANILLKDSEKLCLRPGMYLKGTDVILEITGDKGACYEACARFQSGMPCRLKQECWFARGQKEGVLHISDTLAVLKKI